jgi:hypothetical protein
MCRDDSTDSVEIPVAGENQVSERSKTGSKTWWGIESKFITGIHCGGQSFFCAYVLAYNRKVCTSGAPLLATALYSGAGAQLYFKY